MTTGIYKISASTGECYIGQSVNIEKRFAGHITLLARGGGHKQLQDLYNRVGPVGLSLSILEELPGEQRGSQVLLQREWFWQRQTAGCLGVRRDRRRGSSNEDILAIKQELKAGEKTQAQIAKEFGLSPMQVSFIATNKRYSHIT